MTDNPQALDPLTALRQLIESADLYEAEAKGSHVWDEGGSTETIIRGIQQYRDAARASVPQESPREADNTDGGSRLGSTTPSGGSRLTGTQARALELRDAAPAAAPSPQVKAEAAKRAIPATFTNFAGGGHDQYLCGPECRIDHAALRALAADNPPPDGSSAVVEPGLRTPHALLMPPHPGEVYLSSALCSCGGWQYDADTPGDLSAAYRDVLSDHAAHALAAEPEQALATKLREPGT